MSSRYCGMRFVRGMRGCNDEEHAGWLGMCECEAGRRRVGLKLRAFSRSGSSRPEDALNVIYRYCFLRDVV